MGTNDMKAPQLDWRWHTPARSTRPICIRQGREVCHEGGTYQRASVYFYYL